MAETCTETREQTVKKLMDEAGAIANRHMSMARKGQELTRIGDELAKLGVDFLMKRKDT